MSNSQSMFLQRNTYSTRLSYWLWMYIKRHYPNHCTGDLLAPGMSKQIEISLKAIPDEELEIQKKASLISAIHYSWIENNHYQLTWLCAELSNAMKLPDEFSEPENLNRDYVIALFDLLDSEPKNPPHHCYNQYLADRINLKKEKIGHLREAWENREKPQKSLSWFDNSEDPKRLEIARQLFKKRYPHYVNLFKQFSNFTELVDCFKEHKLTPLEIEVFVTESRKNYSREKSREKNSHKKQLNLEISIDAIDLLNKISQKSGVTRPKIIEILLRMETEKGLYILSERAP